jgi:hypothetical protein
LKRRVESADTVHSGFYPTPKVWKTESTSKNLSQNVGFGVGPLPSAKHKWHIDNALDAKITARVVHNGERGFHIHILWLYTSSISQSYMGFNNFRGICRCIPRLNTASRGIFGNACTRLWALQRTKQKFHP